MRTSQAAPNLFASAAIVSLLDKRPELAASVASLQETLGDGQIDLTEAAGTVLPLLAKELGKDSFDALVEALGDSGVGFDPKAREAFLGLARLGEGFELGGRTRFDAAPARVLAATSAAKQYLGKSVDQLVAGLPLLWKRHDSAKNTDVFAYQTAAGLLKRERQERGGSLAQQEPYDRLTFPSGVIVMAVGKWNDQSHAHAPIADVSVFNLDGVFAYDTRGDGTVGRRSWLREDSSPISERLDFAGEVIGRTVYERGR